MGTQGSAYFGRIDGRSVPAECAAPKLATPKRTLAGAPAPRTPNPAAGKLKHVQESPRFETNSPREFHPEWLCLWGATLAQVPEEKS